MTSDSTPFDAEHPRGSVRTTCRAALLVILALALSASESQATTRRACVRTCKRFARQCTATTSQHGRCQRLLHRLDGCQQRFADVACEATATTTSTTPTSSTTTTTIAGSGPVITVDAPRATTRTITPVGGTLTATGADGTVYALTIPARALLLDTTITMTPIVSVSGGDLPDGAVLGVDLEPSGLRLYEFAELSIAPSHLGATADIAGFSYEGNGDDLHRYPATVDAGRILLHVIHFSGAGANICVELCPPPIVPPPPVITESQLEQLIAQLDPHDPFYAPRLAELLHGYYDLFIAPNLSRMEQDCEYAGDRIPKALAWSRTNQILLAEHGFESENQTIGNSLVRSVSNCWAEATDTCLDVTNAYQVQNLLKIARQAQLLGGDPEVFDLSKVRRCSGLWSGTITHEWTYDDDFSYDVGSSHFTNRNRLTRTQKWQVMPHVIGDPCADCASRMFEATWTGSASVDGLYVKEFPNCTDTSTEQGQIEHTSPSAILIGISKDQTKFYVSRPTAGVQGSPPNGDVYGTSEGKHVPCQGAEETFQGSLHVWETWDSWRFPHELPLGRTDPTIPTTSEGQVSDRDEQTGTVITNTWSWKLTLEPDAGP